MIATKVLELGDGGEVLVVDGLVGEARIVEADAFCRELSFQRLRYGHRDSGNVPMRYGHQWLHLITASEELQLPLAEIRAFAVEHFAGRKLGPGRSHVSCVHPGDERFAHIDDATGKVLTAVYFVNATWTRDGGGELLFFEGGEAARAVFPKPGRVVFFAGTTLHRGGVPTAAAGDVRYALATKLVEGTGAGLTR